MPLIKRQVDPVNVSRTSVASDIANELECVTNNSLSNIIRQLSSLSRHAEDLFSELGNESSRVFERTSHLQTRVGKLQTKITQLDAMIEEVSLQDINLRKPFKASVYSDQQVISPLTRSRAVHEMFQQCEAPPALSKLNEFREDGKDSLKFYTDPMYFFDLWCKEIQRTTEKTKRELRDRRQKRKQPKPRQAQNNIRKPKTKKEFYDKMAKGEEFMEESGDSGELLQRGVVESSSGSVASLPPRNQAADDAPDYIHPPPYNSHNISADEDSFTEGYRGANQSGQQQRSTPVRGGVATAARPSQPPPAPPALSRDAMQPSSPGDLYQKHHQHNDQHHAAAHDAYNNMMENEAADALPPPPPPPLATTASSYLPPPLTPPMGAQGDPPPAPPLPPSPLATSKMAPLDDAIYDTGAPPTNNTEAAEEADERSDLLAEIRKGFQLRRSADRRSKEGKKQATVPSAFDVQSIMEAAFEMRRKAIEDNDSDEEDADDTDLWEDGED